MPSLSLRSSELPTYPAGASHDSKVVSGSPNPSPSESRNHVDSEQVISSSPQDENSRVEMKRPDKRP